MTDHAWQWLEANKEAAMAAQSFEEFCASQGNIGAYYAKYKWLKKHWEVLKERGFIMYRALEMPKARAWSDLFEEARIENTSKPARGYKTARPAGFFFISEDHNSGDTICGHYGGTRSLDHTRTYGDGAPIRQHYGAAFHVCIVKPKFKVPANASFRAVKRVDGATLVTYRTTDYPGETWLALLDEGDSLESLLSVADQQFLANEREAEKVAYAC